MGLEWKRKEERMMSVQRRAVWIERKESVIKREREREREKHSRQKKQHEMRVIDGMLVQ